MVGGGCVGGVRRRCGVCGEGGGGGGGGRGCEEGVVVFGRIIFWVLGVVSFGFGVPDLGPKVENIFIASKDRFHRKCWGEGGEEGRSLGRDRIWLKLDYPNLARPSLARFFQGGGPKVGGLKVGEARRLGGGPK